MALVTGRSRRQAHHCGCPKSAFPLDDALRFQGSWRGCMLRCSPNCRIIEADAFWRLDGWPLSARGPLGFSLRVGFHAACISTGALCVAVLGMFSQFHYTSNCRTIEADAFWRFDGWPLSARGPLGFSLRVGFHAACISTGALCVAALVIPVQFSTHSITLVLLIGINV